MQDFASAILNIYVWETTRNWTLQWPSRGGSSENGRCLLRCQPHHEPWQSGSDCEVLSAAFAEQHKHADQLLSGRVAPPQL